MCVAHCHYAFFTIQGIITLNVLFYSQLCYTYILIFSRDVPVDYALYVKFWQLQSFFSSPSSCYEKTKWRTFQHVCAVFQILKFCIGIPPLPGYNTGMRNSCTLFFFETMGIFK